VWAERAGWLPGDRLWIAERGGDVAVFNRELDFSDLWEIPDAGDPLTVTGGGGGLTALLLAVEDNGEALLRRVTRAGDAVGLDAVSLTDTLVVCPDGSCYLTLRALGDTLGFEVARTDIGAAERTGRFRLPRAPDRDGRTWLGLAEDDSERAYWLILGPAGQPIGRFQLTGGQEGLLVRDGVFWARREVDGVTWLHRYEFSAP
jgi:hypothetical protein